MDFAELYEAADIAGKMDADACIPTPMIVQQRTNALDDSSPIVKSWNVAGGVCGFAWVNIRPGNSKFANWLKKNGYARKDSYYGGVSIWVSDYGQSMELKEAYAKGFAEVIAAQLDNVKVYAMSRMD